ncbi:hypothetical protein HZA57_01785 [Candidatus Poribacteria bacterium]|nr:hypothetical protein [Candidatus Poribacteria bacterium]
MARRVTSALVFAALAVAAGAQTVQTYTEASLGYPVPIPQTSVTPIEGFRTYDSLVTRGTDLALEYEHVSRHLIGTTFRSRDIYGYVISDAGDAGPDGTAETGSLVNGTIHAREWASPEILTHLLEYFAQEYGTDPIATYLVDQNRIVLIPVLNVDGFLQTQRYPDKYIGSSDGRMRRKNMRNVDEDLAGTLGDSSSGVDCNRNLSVGFGNGSSPTPSSEVYRGSAAFSEPETQRLRDAIGLFRDPGQLGFYADVHGAIPALYSVYNGVDAADQATDALAFRMRNVYDARNGISSSYADLPVFPGEYIGATDEYHAVTYKVPGFTIEYPTPRFRVPGGGPTFILPDDEVRQTVDENHYAILLGFLFASGPPIIERVTFWGDANSDGRMQPAEIRQQRQWHATAPGGTARGMDSVTTGTLSAGKSYQVIVQFNQPMRLHTEGGQPGNWPGMTFAIEPSAHAEVSVARQAVNLSIPASTGWQAEPGTADTPGYARYQYDTWIGRLDLSQYEELAEQTAVLSVSTQNLYGHALDARPQTLARWDAGWLDYENASGTGNSGGEDRALSIAIGPPEPEGSPSGWQIY